MARLRMVTLLVLAAGLCRPQAVQAFFDNFTGIGINYTGSNSYNTGGSFSISASTLKITTGADNTYSVMTTGVPPFGIGDVFSLDVPAVSVNQGVFMMCSTTAYQPNGSSSFGFRFRREGGMARMNLYPGGILSPYPTDPDPTKPATLFVVRTSATEFAYAIGIAGQVTPLGSFSLPQLSGYTTLHIGAQAYAWSSGTVFAFDKLSIRPRIHNVTRDLWYETIQSAITDAQDGEHLEAGPGTYMEAIHFMGKAIRLYSTGGADMTFIDGDGAIHVLTCISGEGPNTVVEGFTITGGHAEGATTQNMGGGMYNSLSSPTVTGCIFENNWAKVYGGGLYNTQSSPTVTDCIFRNNSADATGGGMYNKECSSTVIHCTFSSNSADEYGGGMYNYYSSLFVTDCEFTGNQAGEAGGGMHNYHSNATVMNSHFDGNWGMLDRSGGMCNEMYSDSAITHCTFTGNFGGGMRNIYMSSPTITNCSFYGNIVDNYGGGMYNYLMSYPTVTNCIFWNNMPNEITDYGESYPVLTYCDVMGGYPGQGNIDADPCFADADAGDLRLSAGSPCIDAGSDSAVPEGVTTDAEGFVRFVDGNCDTVKTVDMGAIEYSHRYQGDLNDDCVVDLADFAVVSGCWYSAAKEADIAEGYGDGVVDIIDLAVVAAHWLEAM